MVNLESMGNSILVNIATLASMSIALAGLALTIAPILAIVRLPSAAPCWAGFAIHILRLPRSHAFAAAKVVFLYFCILAAKLLAAPIAAKKFATPTKKNTPAFRGARQLVGAFDPIWLDLKALSTDWALETGAGGMGFTKDPLAFVATKPQASCIASNLIGLASNRLSAVGARQ